MHATRHHHLNPSLPPSPPIDLQLSPPNSAPPSPSLSPTTSADLPSPSLKASLLPLKDFSPSTDSLHLKEAADSLPPLLTPAIPPPSSSFPSYHSRGGFGQDAWFVESVAGSALHSLGVADGVGGWRSQGVDSGIISRAVMEKCMQQVIQSRDTLAPNASTTKVHGKPSPPSTLSTPPLSSSQPPTLPFSLPSQILTKAYSRVKDEKVVTAGSTTACVLTITPYRCMPHHQPALNGRTDDKMEGVEGDPRSPPPSPRDFEQRHQLSSEDEQKEGTGRPPSSNAVPVPSPSPSYIDSDSDSDVEESFTSHVSPSTSMESTDSTQGGSPPSLSYKTASAFWNAVGQVMAPTSQLSTSHNSTSSLPASPMTSPPPSRPPSPTTPPLFLSCASLGDSGFLLLRHHRVIHRSDIQRTGRIVKQLAIIPPHLSGPQHRYCDDAPTDAALSSHRIEEGDIIIVGSDGLLDNLCSSWGGTAGFFVPWGRFLLGGGGGGEDEGDKEVLEKQNRKVEAMVKECWIDWEAREMEGGVKGQGGKEGFVRVLCDRLVHEATEFMTTVEGKPDDLTVLVAQVGKMR